MYGKSSHVWEVFMIWEAFPDMGSLPKRLAQTNVSYGQHSDMQTSTS
jgi:hypothetical protein